ncbi:MAG: FecR family protein [Verrucomicrobia bacterium]|nr:FecR family protein [Verrucomicrobiota bacterium]MBU1735772.1 FecR family protein [Verrucomicrobiota bacterium]MBU1855572.1 FecR family protein [Verrucomicrobiota bacterium]
MNAGNKGDIKNEAVKRAFDGLLFAHFGLAKGGAAAIMGQIMADAAVCESKRRVMEGILAVSTGFGNEAANSKYFINNVMNGIKATSLKSGEALTDGHKNIFAIRNLSLAASFMILLGVGGICLMAHYNGGAKGRPASRPCLLTSTPGGLLERNMKRSAINNGMQIEDKDIIRTYAGSCSFVMFSDLSRIEIGGGSTIKFSEVSGLNTGSGTQPGGRKMCLREGVIDADILKAKNHGVFKVSLPGGELSARDARFILAVSNGSVFVEVSCGSVSLELADKPNPLTIEAGYCLVLSQEGTSKLLAAELSAEGSKAGARFAELKKQLSLSESKYEELLVNYQKRKNVDICLENTIKSIKRRGANYS